MNKESARKILFTNVDETNDKEEITMYDSVSVKVTCFITDNCEESVTEKKRTEQNEINQ